MKVMMLQTRPASPGDAAGKAMGGNAAGKALAKGAVHDTAGQVGGRPARRRRRLAGARPTERTHTARANVRRAGRLGAA